MIKYFAPHLWQMMTFLNPLALLTPPPPHLKTRHPQTFSALIPPSLPSRRPNTKHSTAPPPLPLDGGGVPRNDREHLQFNASIPIPPQLRGSTLVPSRGAAERPRSTRAPQLTASRPPDRSHTGRPRPLLCACLFDGSA